MLRTDDKETVVFEPPLESFTSPTLVCVALGAGALACCIGFGVPAGAGPLGGGGGGG
jgi:hypothetical protein